MKKVGYARSRLLGVAGSYHDELPERKKTSYRAIAKFLSRLQILERVLECTALSRTEDKESQHQTPLYES